MTDDLFSFAGVPLEPWPPFVGPVYKHPLYLVWKGIKRRCYNPGDRAFPRYGGRGIIVCEAWRKTPRAFMAWALWNGWQRGLHVDRIDNDGPYAPDNCRCVSQRVNNQNTRRTVRLRDGSALSAAVPTNGLSMQAVRARVRAGVDPDAALSLRSRYYRRVSDGRTFKDAALSAGVPLATANMRFWRGWSADDAATVPVGGKRPAPK